MATAKHRINISVDKDLVDILGKVAKRDEKPLATKARELIERALEIEEDLYFSKIAAEREKKHDYVDEEEFWRQALK